MALHHVAMAMVSMAFQRPRYSQAGQRWMGWEFTRSHLQPPRRPRAGAAACQGQDACLRPRSTSRYTPARPVAMVPPPPRARTLVSRSVGGAGGTDLPIPAVRPRASRPQHSGRYRHATDRAGCHARGGPAGSIDPRRMFRRVPIACLYLGGRKCTPHPPAVMHGVRRTHWLSRRPWERPACPDGRDQTDEDQCAPRPENTAGIVFSSTTMSCQIVQLFTYQTSSCTRLAYEMLLRPLTCQSPVRPGRIA
jgi:hypothetical protein